MKWGIGVCYEVGWNDLGNTRFKSWLGYQLSWPGFFVTIFKIFQANASLETDHCNLLPNTYLLMAHDQISTSFDTIKPPQLKRTSLNILRINHRLHYFPKRETCNQYGSKFPAANTLSAQCTLLSQWCTSIYTHTHTHTQFCLFTVL